MESGELISLRVDTKTRPPESNSLINNNTECVLCHHAGRGQQEGEDEEDDDAKQAEASTTLPLGHPFPLLALAPLTLLSTRGSLSDREGKGFLCRRGVLLLFFVCEHATCEQESFRVRAV